EFPRLRNLRNNKFPLHNSSPTLRRQSRSSKSPPNRKSNNLNSPPHTRFIIRNSRSTSTRRNNRPSLRTSKIHCNNINLRHRSNIRINLGYRGQTLHSRNYPESLSSKSVCSSTMGKLDYEFHSCVDCSVFPK